MMRGHNTFTEVDIQVRHELISFFPDHIFDVHAHIWRASDVGLSETSFFSNFEEEVSVDVWRNSVQQLFGKRVRGGLLFPYFIKTTDLDKVNQYVANQLEHEELSKGLIAVSPEYPDEQVESFLENKNIIGFKPYHIFSPVKVTFDSEILDFVPERFWQWADRYGLIIMLHIVKDLAIADPENQRQLLDLCNKYPNAKCILAHSARCFHAPHAKAVKALRTLDNIYFDMSAICEAEAIVPILHELGPKKLMWGSDFPVSQLRGKAVTVGNGFFWMQKETIDWDHAIGRTEPTLAGLESLRALKTASELVGLSKKDIEHIFYHNAVRLTSGEHR